LIDHTESILLGCGTQKIARSKLEESIQLSVKFESRKYQERSRKGQDFINKVEYPLKKQTADGRRRSVVGGQ
jgi:hypothetical protein